MLTYVTILYNTRRLWVLSKSCLFPLTYFQGKCPLEHENQSTTFVVCNIILHLRTAFEIVDSKLCNVAIH